MSEDTGRLVGGRYRLGGVLGRGGMGTVWRGEDEILGRRVAVKELRFPSSVDEEEKQRLITRTLREAKAIARIRSGSAVTVFDVVNEDSRPWIVMELVEGRSLADQIKKDGPLDPQRAAEVGLAILDVLRAAHREGILHRDVKPSNVLLEDGTGRVVLTDFGIAKVEGDPSVTSTGMLVGAPSYISPERARGKPPGPPADLWSLGGLLYAAVEGRPPYDKGSAISTLTAVMTEPVPVPEHAGELREVIAGLLVKDPEKRLDVNGARLLLEPVANGLKSPLSPARGDVERTSMLPRVEAPAPPGGPATPSAPGKGNAAEGSGPAYSPGTTGGRRKRRSEGTSSGERLRGALKSVRNAAGAVGGAATGAGTPDTGTRPGGPGGSQPGGKRGTATDDAKGAAGSAVPPRPASPPSTSTSTKRPGGGSDGTGASGSRSAKSPGATPGTSSTGRSAASARRSSASSSGSAPAPSAPSAPSSASSASSSSASSPSASSSSSGSRSSRSGAAAGGPASGASSTDRAARPGTGAQDGAAAGGTLGGGPLPGAGSGSRALPPESGGSGAITSLRDLRELPELRKGLPPRTLAIVIAAVVAVIVVVVLLIVGLGGDDKGGDGAKGPAASTGQAGQGSGEGQDVSAGGKQPAAGEGQKTEAGGDGEEADENEPDEDELPEGYATVKDERFHFSMALPEGWKRTGIAGRNSGGKYTAPGGGHPKIQIDHTDSPGPDAAGAWRAQEPAVKSASSGYKSLGIKKVEWRGYPTVADWHFLRKDDGKKVHVLNRGFKVDGENGYAILITCEADTWQDEECETLRDTAFKTFKPL